MVLVELRTGCEGQGLRQSSKVCGGMVCYVGGGGICMSGVCVWCIGMCVMR